MAAAMVNPVFGVVLGYPAGYRSDDGFRRPVGFDAFSQAGHLVGGQVVEHDYVAGRRRGTGVGLGICWRQAANTSPLTAPLTGTAACRPVVVSAATNVTFGPPCKGVAWGACCPPGAQASRRQ